MIVEDGTGLTDSNSYVSVVFADDYFTSRGNSEWLLLDETEKEVLLIKATDYIDNVFEWNGFKMGQNQALRFPRRELVDYEGISIQGIPNCLQQAVCDCAELLRSGNELFETANANGSVTYEKIGDLAFRYATKETEEITHKTLYDMVNTKLRGLYKNKLTNTIVRGQVKRSL